ncbi:MAG: hypothetical protein ABIC82_04515 [bacterium]
MDIKFKLTYSYALKLIYGLIAVVLIIGAYFLISFLYTNFYQVMIQTEDIAALRKDVSNEIVDVELFEKVFANLNEKQKKLPFDIKNVKNVFGSSSPEINFKNPIGY